LLVVNLELAQAGLSDLHNVVRDLLEPFGQLADPMKSCTPTYTITVPCQASTLAMAASAEHSKWAQETTQEVAT
jgi:hypothetical protein